MIGRHVKLRVFQVVRQVLLLHIAAVIVRIFVSRYFLLFIIDVAKIHRNCFFLYRLYGALRLVAGNHDTVRLFAFAHANYRFRKRQSTFRHTDFFISGKCARRDHQRIRICHADVFCGMSDDTPENQQRIAPGVDKSHRPVKPRVAVAAAQRLAKRRQHIVIIVVAYRQNAFLYALRRNFFRDMNRPVGRRGRRDRRKFQRVQRRSYVSARSPRKVFKRAFLRNNVHIEKPAFVVYRAV